MSGYRGVSEIRRIPIPGSYKKPTKTGIGFLSWTQGRVSERQLGWFVTYLLTCLSRSNSTLTTIVFPLFLRNGETYEIFFMTPGL